MPIICASLAWPGLRMKFIILIFAKFDFKLSCARMTQIHTSQNKISDALRAWPGGPMKFSKVQDQGAVNLIIRPRLYIKNF